eukprot:CAMPEP_0114419714 /NCGR_PEP_ID=MMETSP0103-20121206/4178_1 /TAXON_ID=37642 ORGANISM="Paraphysomonas imperforata, Strain PA2" /NCGR_SAMPLE_ID=MMETSP0103 /ASSEMBLY_ACC=CAM_ASM_000201 /LENGTH=61 /DNA_ID=CAMNT_0001588159 /DNA_START=130 /DNA_END=315 /DNA_ORIENTATION=+
MPPVPPTPALPDFPQLVPGRLDVCPLFVMGDKRRGDCTSFTFPPSPANEDTLSNELPPSTD